MADEIPRQFPHFYLREHGQAENFTSPLSGGGGGGVPERDRAEHAAQLEQALGWALEAAQQQKAERNPDLAGERPGFYLEFEFPKAQQSHLEKLENRQGGSPIEIMASRPALQNPDMVTATVFVPEARSEYFLKKVRAYANEDFITYEKDADRKDRVDEQGNKVEKSRRPKNEDLVASIETARLGELQSLYTDDMAFFPDPGQEVWWEVWVRSWGREDFERAARILGIPVREHAVAFAERSVLLARAAPETIRHIVINTDTIAEIRLARDTPGFFMEMDGAEQREWSDDVLERLRQPPLNAPAVCLLDSGTTRRHPLLSPVLAPGDQQAWHPDWNVEDVSANWQGHGTAMSGVAVYGDLTETLTGGGAIELTHRLESVKILPDRGDNDPDLYGYITASAVARAEVQAPERPRVVCLPVTSDGDHWAGRPSSWSAAIDDLAYGDGDDQRLIVVSAGNIGTYYPAVEYLAQNDTAKIESPAQAWNALTVGAMTEKCNFTDPAYRGWRSMAPAGDLSPASRTSVNWQNDWPIKPDVVFEGGNHGVDPATGDGDHVDDLALLTTFRRPEERPFTVTGDTSAATALAASMAAKILADRPALWPETVRALIVHSAEWTPAMRGHLPAQVRQGDKRRLVRRYGYGVPNLPRALRSLTDDVTMVVEGEIQPYTKEKSRVKTCEMMLHDLPWPTDALRELGDAQVEMRVTLSYFVEPNPGERGWTKRHTYSGHGLRFRVKRPEESLDRFRKRINAAALEDDEAAVRGGGEEGWELGPNLRNRGSIHSDIWLGNAADLAGRHGIAVYPVGGWWREKSVLGRVENRVRYSLIVTLRNSVGVDLYTEISNEVGVQVEVEA